MKKHLSIYFPIFFFSIFLSHNPVIAQITIGDSSLVGQPRAISIDNINSRFETTQRQLKTIRKKTEISKKFEKAKTDFDDYSEFLGTQHIAYNNFKKSHPKKINIINLINKWGSYVNTLDSWQKEVNGYIEKNLVWLKELDVLEAEWNLTYEKMVENNSSKLAKDNSKKMFNEVKVTKAFLLKQNNALLNFENEILQQKENLSNTIEELEQWKSSETFSTLYKRHLEIWNYEKESSELEGQFDIWISLKENIKDIVTYFRIPANGLKTYLIFIVLFLSWLTYLKSRYQKMTDVDSLTYLDRSKNVIVQHFYGTLIFVIVISSIIYFKNTPLLFNDVLLIIGVASTIPILRPITNNKFSSLIFVILFLFLVNITKSHLWYSALVFRMYLFLETLLVATSVFVFTYPYLVTRNLKLNRASQFLLRLSPFVYLLMIISVISNVLGYTNLTELILTTVVEGSAILTLIYGIMEILGGVTNAFIIYYLSALPRIDHDYKKLVLKRASGLVKIFSALFLFYYFLQTVDFYDIITEAIYDFLNSPYVIGSTTIRLMSFLSFFFILFVTFSITRLLSNIIDGGALDFMSLPKGVPTIISVVTRYFLIGFGFILAISALGIDLTQFNLMAGALGLGIGFGLQNIISNFISGLILIFERPIQTNDVVEMGTIIGTVKKIGIRSSNIHTFDGAEVIVPNSNLISNEVTNWTLSDAVKRVEIRVGTAYGTDLTKVVGILKDVAENYTEALKDPEPLAFFDAFGDSSLDFRLLVWVPVEIAFKAKSEVAIEVYKRFKEEGVEIPFPQRDLHIKSDERNLDKKN